jgi:hypothetical protein
VASSVIVTQNPFSHGPGPSTTAAQSAPGFEPRPQEAMPATRGDIIAVIHELREIRGVLEQIRDAFQQERPAD